MSRYEVITFVWHYDYSALTPLPGLPPNGFLSGYRYQGIPAPPSEFIAAVNAALAAGATLVGGVSIFCLSNESTSWVFSQAVLYPPPVKVLVAASALEAGPPAEDGAAGGAAGSGAAV
jgi:hypothetical protein